MSTKKVKPVDVDSIIEGKPVSNEEILYGIQMTKETIRHPNVQAGLTEEGEIIAQDAEKLADATAKLLIEKNYGEELQKIHSSVQFITQRALDNKRQLSPEELQTQQDMKSFFQGLEQFSSALLTSQSLRKELRRLNRVLLESMASEDDTEGPEWEQHRSHQGLDREEYERHRGGYAQEHEREQGYGQERGADTQGYQQETPQGFEQGVLHHERGFDERRTSSSSSSSSSDDNKEREAEFKQGEEILRKGSKGMGRKKMRKNTENTRSNYKIVLGGKEFGFLERRLSEKQLENISHVLQSVIMGVHNDNTLKQSLGNMVQFLKDIQDEMQNRFKKISDPEIERARQDILHNVKVLICRFASDHSLDELGRTAHALNERTKNDKELLGDWNELLNFLRKSIDNSESVRQNHWKPELQDKVQLLHRHLYNYRSIMFRMVQEIDLLMTDVREDQVVQEFTGATRALTDDLFLSEDGKVTFKPQALNEFRKILVPVFEKQFQYISLPKFAGSDNEMEYEINHMILKGSVLLPDTVWVENSSHLRMQSKGNLVYQSGIHIVLQNMHIEARNIDIRFKRKVFPKISDEGKLNVHVEGGTSIQLWLSTDSKDDRVLHVDNVDCTMGAVKLYGLKFAQHEKLYYFFRPLIQFVFKKQAEKAIEEQLKKLMIQLDEKAIQAMKTSANTNTGERQQATDPPIHQGKRQHDPVGHGQQQHSSLHDQSGQQQHSSLHDQSGQQQYSRQHDPLAHMAEQHHSMGGQQGKQAPSPPRAPQAPDAPQAY